MKRNKKIFSKGAYLVDESRRGSFTEQSNAIVMDNTLSRDPKHLNKMKISYIITHKPKFWAGQNTVVVFKIKKRLLEAGA